MYLSFAWGVKILSVYSFNMNPWAFLSILFKHFDAFRSVGHLLNKALTISSMADSQLQKQYKTFAAAPRYSLDSEELFCVCRKPDTGKLMVACDGCDEWFHFKCMGLDPRYKDLVSNYYCKFCSELFNKGKTLWKRKCKLFHCFKPIDTNAGVQSQFCSREHGLLYWRGMLDQFDLDAHDVPNFNATDAMEKDQVISLLQNVTTRQEFPALGEKLPLFDKGPLYISDARKHEMLENETFVKDCAAKIELYKSRRAHLGALKEIIAQINECITVSLDPNSTNTGVTGDSTGENGDAAHTPAEEKEKKKKSKAKRNQKSRKLKIDICGYDARLELDDKQWSEYISSQQQPDPTSLSEEDLHTIVTAYRALKSEDVGTEPMDVDPSQTILDKLCTSEKRKCTLHNGWFNIFKGSLELKINELTFEQQAKIKANEELNKAIQIKNWKIYCGDE